MNLDDKIKHALENESAEIDAILSDRRGLFDLAGSGLRGGMRRWMIIATIMAIVVSVFMVFSGVQFFLANDIDARVFWGVWFVVSSAAQIGLKQWIWMETNRVSVLREIKRVELAVERLAEKKGI